MIVQPFRFVDFLAAFLTVFFFAADEVTRFALANETEGKVDIP